MLQSMCVSSGGVIYIRCIQEFIDYQNVITTNFEGELLVMQGEGVGPILEIQKKVEELVKHKYAVEVSVFPADSHPSEGSLVECIRDLRGVLNLLPHIGNKYADAIFPSKGEIYTIREWDYDVFNMSWVIRLVEVINPPKLYMGRQWEVAFLPCHFKSINHH